MGLFTFYSSDLWRFLTWANIIHSHVVKITYQRRPSKFSSFKNMNGYTMLTKSLCFSVLPIDGTIRLVRMFTIFGVSIVLCFMIQSWYNNIVIHCVVFNKLFRVVYKLGQVVRTRLVDGL